MSAEKIPGQRPLIHRKPRPVIKGRESFSQLPLEERKKVKKWAEGIKEEDFIQSTKVGS